MTHSPTLAGRRIVLGVCGGIAAYKTAELIRQLKKEGSEVQVIVTAEATRFVTPLTLGTLSEREVLSEIFPANADGSWTRHISLGSWADVFVIAPATAQTMAKLAHGFSDNMLTAVALAARCPVLVCPAMDHDMYVHPATQANLKTLETYGYGIMPPEHGELASGLVGVGRLPEPDAIVDRIRLELGSRMEDSVLFGRRVVVSAGPTREALDPVRYLSNRSSGRMGFALAEAAERRGAEVTLVSGPTTLPTPPGVQRVDVTSAAEMKEAIDRRADADVIVMAAAVADFRPAERSPGKIKKSGDALTLRLDRTEDILLHLGNAKRPGQVLVGFALETDRGLENARQKLVDKNLDLVVLNNPLEEGAGFDHDTNRVTLLDSAGDVEEAPLMSKRSVAAMILDRVERMVRER